MRWRRGAALLLTALMALLAACTVGPSDRPEIVVVEQPDLPPEAPAPATVPGVPDLEEPNGSTITWNRCSDGVTARLAQPALPAWLTVQCARVSTPLDSPYAPGRGSIRMLVLRAGTGPIPIVVVNDIDGLAGTIYAARLAATLPQDFLARFSLIGVDRRGTGFSDAPDCVPHDVRVEIAGIDPREADVGSWSEPAKTAGQQCSIELESRLPALDSWRSAADLDNVRLALGLERLNGIGHGEGSRVLSVYADRFPSRIGRLVLDGLPDTNQDAVTSLEGVAAGAEATWQAFAADCKARGCELGADPHQALPELLTALRIEPLDTGSELRLGSGLALRAVLTGLADRKSWPALSAAIDKARKGDGAALAALLTPVMQGTDDLPPTFDGQLVVGCNDTKTRLDLEHITSTAQTWNKKYPLFGALVAQRLALCGVWPVQTQPLPTPAARGGPPIMVVGTASDPVTPLSGTEHAKQELSNAVLISWQGAGHGAVGVSGCATTAVRAFFAEAQLPRDGTVCPP